ncbi:MAG: hypothetical protein IKO11_01775 [Lachnospiraceae bacterium]|nr:hypothetical protein [Lachnospiraceae bacterium]
MSGLLNKAERKLGKYAIPHLPLVMLIIYATGFLMEKINPEIILYLSLNPYAILHGEVWRIISWVLIPPESDNLFLVLIMLYFYYSIGTTLERTWGNFYFNLYIFSGILFTVLGAFCFYGYVMLFGGGAEALALEQLTLGSGNAVPGGSVLFAYSSLMFSTYYINMSIFLAFAATYPDMQVLLMFIIPIRVKVLGVIYAIFLVYEAWEMGLTGLFVIGASLLNFLVFFLMTRKRLRRSPQMRARQRAYKREVHESMNTRTIARHKCAICGRTSEDYPDLEFRFCSKCEGNYEYCQDHLFSHKHIVRNEK